VHNPEDGRPDCCGVVALQAVAFLAVAAVVMAGCAGSTQPGSGGGSDARAALMAVRFDPLRVHVTPDELNEHPGDSGIAWSEEAFGILAGDSHSGLFRMTVLAGGLVYGSNFGIGWVSTPYPPSKGNPASPLVALWDLRTLAADPDLHVAASNGGANYTLVGFIERGGQHLAVDLQLGVRDGAIVWGRMVSQGTRESPFIFHSGGPLPFLLQVPSPSADSDVVAGKQDAATTAHRALVNLIQDYVSHHAGSVPKTVTPDTLAVELVASGQKWPTNPYSGNDLKDAQASGDFTWAWCSDTVAAYSGHAWDGPVMYKPFGSQRCP